MQEALMMTVIRVKMYDRGSKVFIRFLQLIRQHLERLKGDRHYLAYKRN